MKKIAALILALMLSLTAVLGLAESVEVTYESRDVQVPATVVLPELAEGAKAPVVVFAHGHGGSRNEGFGAIADALAEKGIASIRMDFSGCGESTESFQLNTLTNMKQDVVNALAYMTANYPVDADKAGLFGYSMGGRIALELLAEEACDVKAVAMLAPAASSADLKNFFGGAEVYDPLAEKAAAEGYATFTNMYGAVQDLSKEWFEDMAKMPEDSAQQAVAKYTGKALVIYGEDDNAVNPAVSKAVAEALKAQVVVNTGDQHSYGFYSDKTDILNTVCTSAADFFAAAFAE